MNLMIGTLLYLWPKGSVNTTHTGGQIINRKNKSIIFQAGHVRLPRQSSCNIHNQKQRGSNLVQL